MSGCGGRNATVSDEGFGACEILKLSILRSSKCFDLYTIMQTMSKVEAGGGGSSGGDDAPGAAMHTDFVGRLSAPVEEAIKEVRGGFWCLCFV